MPTDPHERTHDDQVAPPLSWLREEVHVSTATRERSGPDVWSVLMVAALIVIPIVSLVVLFRSIIW